MIIYFTKLKKRILLLQIFFRQIIDNKLLLKIAKWTNQHHQQQLKSEKGGTLKNSHILKWNDCTIDDIYNYILLQIYFGTIKLPDIKVCWSKNIYLNQKYVVNKMTRDRYYQISKNIR